MTRSSWVSDAASREWSFRGFGISAWRREVTPRFRSLPL
jgi:hypothetical protein